MTKLVVLCLLALCCGAAAATQGRRASNHAQASNQRMGVWSGIGAKAATAAAAVADEPAVEAEADGEVIGVSETPETPAAEQAAAHEAEAEAPRVQAVDPHKSATSGRKFETEADDGSSDGPSSSTIAIAVLVPIAVVFVLGIILSNSIYIVRQSEAIIIERFGTFKSVLQSGINFVVPFIDRPRTFTWQYTAISLNGTVIDETRQDFRVDLREAVYNFLKQEVYTKDTILLDVRSLMYYRINDVKRAVYEVDDLQSALSNTAQSQLKDVFGSMTFSKALRSQTEINEHLKKGFGKLFANWGIEVLRMELLDLAPARAERITTEAMKDQMMAERGRRGEFIRSEGKKAAMKLRAEGDMQVAKIMGTAQQEATRKVSEGQANATVELATAEKNSLEVIGAAINRDNTSRTDYLLSKKYLGFLRGLASSIDTRNLYIPYATQGISGLVASLGPAFGQRRPVSLLSVVPAGGRGKDKGAAPAAAAATAAKPAVAFAELGDDDKQDS